MHFTACLINLEILKKSFRKVSSQIYQSPGHLLETITVYLDRYFTSVDFVTALTFSIPQYAIWLSSCSSHHGMPLDCFHVPYTILCCWLSTCSSHHNTSCKKYLLTYSMEQSPSWEANWFCSLSRNSPHFMEPESSLPYSQAPATM